MTSKQGSKLRGNGAGFWAMALLVGICVLALPSQLRAQWTNGSNINNTNPGNVGIGTTTPTAKLEIFGWDWGGSQD